MKIAFFDTKPYDSLVFDEINQSYNYDIEYFESRLTEKNVILAQGFDVVCVFVRDKVTHKVIDELVKYGVKMIALRCAGYNNVDLEAASGKIKVVRVPSYSPYAIAEFTVSMMLTLNRKIHKAYQRTRDMNFSLDRLMGFDMRGKTIGIIGTGKIAKILIKILKGFEMEILAYDIYPDEEYAAEIGYKYTDLEELYQKSDIISLHCPLTPSTEYLINKSTIEKMKKGVMIINTGRGKLINTQDLIEGLKQRKVGAAGLDVYEEEERYFYEDYSEKMLKDDILARLLTFPNVLITSHQAFFTKEAIENICNTTLESCKQLEHNKTLKNEIAYICDEKGCVIKDVVK